MPCLTEIVDTIMAEEARRAMAAVPVPRAPDVRPAADELAEPELGEVPAHRTAVENAAAVVAAIGLALPFLPL
jgi:hypothetical protein